MRIGEDPVVSSAEVALGAGDRMNGLRPPRALSSGLWVRLPIFFQKTALRLMRYSLNQGGQDHHAIVWLSKTAKI
ncbi:unnamed protein product [Arctia plantaginis]|uniref:Uncharacterized protein n=1 Tax=Arctia plantaginis TaxID=874455 RepID=A0A8S0ZTN4_ARCPL|nr:unnamed protein product [Arctia plantaginis]